MSHKIVSVANRTCWYCGVTAHHTMRLDPVPKNLEAMEHRQAYMAAYRCDECGVLSIGVLWGHQHSGATTNIKSTMDVGNAPLEWLPKRGFGKAYPHVPDAIASAASEAHACDSIGSYRAAIVMARSVIEATAKDQGITVRGIEGKIDKMAEDGLIRPLVQEQAHEVRHLGNDMAHGDFVDPVTAEESAEILALMGELLEEVYQAPARLQALKAARIAKTTGSP